MEIIDTFPSFVTVWVHSQAQPVDRQIEAWESNYMQG
jgi:hypothetical protein